MPEENNNNNSPLCRFISNWECSRDPNGKTEESEDRNRRNNHLTTTENLEINSILRRHYLNCSETYQASDDVDCKEDCRDSKQVLNSNKFEKVCHI